MQAANTKLLSIPVRLTQVFESSVQCSHNFSACLKFIINLLPQSPKQLPETSDSEMFYHVHSAGWSKGHNKIPLKASIMTLTGLST